MKRLLLLVPALFFTILASQLLRAQTTLPDLLEGEDDESTILADSADGPQRIGIPAATFELAPSESGSIAGYCFDEHLIAPGRVTSFDHVLAGNEAAVVRTADGRERSLRQAVRNGDVAIRAQQLTVAFMNRSGQPMQVRLSEPMVLWDRPAGQVNPLALAALGAPNASYDARQKAIWKVTNTERRLHALGYLAGSMYDYDRDRLVAAVNAFQKEHGMEPTKDLDLSTIQRVATVESALRDRLRALGFASRDARYAREALASQIRGYEKFLGRPASGRWSDALATSLGSTESILPRINAIRPSKGEQIADVLSGEKAATVLTYVNDGKGMMVLTGTDAGVELWKRTGRMWQVTAREADALRAIDRAAATLAARASKEGRVVIYPGLSKEGVASITVGERTVDVSARELAAWVDGGAIPAALQNLLDALVPPSVGTAETGGTTPKTFIVYQSPLNQGRAGATVRRLGLEQADAAQLATALDRTYGGRASIYISNDLRIGADRFEPSMGSVGYSTMSRELAFAE